MERGRDAGATPSQRHFLAQRLNQALGDSLRISIGAQHFGIDGRLKSPVRALIPGIDESLLPKGPSGIDGVRLRQADGPAALTLNTFINWVRQPQLMRLAGETGFRELRFDARCPTGIRGTPPLLELIAGNERTVVAVTARCADYLSLRPRKLASAYDRVTPSLSSAPWLGLLPLIRGEPSPFRYVDAAGLLKHAVGLSQTFPNRPVKLAYLYWEPVNAAQYPAFAEHRAELSMLADHVAGSSVTLAAQSFDELWSEWQSQPEPDWLRGMVARLKARYSVAIAEPSGI